MVDGEKPEYELSEEDFDFMAAVNQKAWEKLSLAYKNQQGRLLYIRGLPFSIGTRKHYFRIKFKIF